MISSLSSRNIVTPHVILNLLILDRMQPVFNDFNSTHSSLKQLNKLTFLFNPIKSKERVNDDPNNSPLNGEGYNR